MTTNTVYWVRHGESWVNLRHEFSYRIVDKPLTPKGVLQAQQTAARFRDVPVAAIYASPLSRAVQTAEAIGEAVGRPVVALEELRELNVGRLEEDPISEASWRIFAQVVNAWWAGDDDAVFPGGEDRHALVARITAGLREATRGRDGETVVVVSHGGNFMNVLRDIVPTFDLALARETGVSNCSVTRMELTTEGERVEGVIQEWNACGHLSGEAAELVSGVPAGLDEPEK
ncbi:MAG: histidine phosphatase family protein [Anaerolineae bacterium]